MTSSAAKKAWATRRKFHPQKWKKRKKYGNLKLTDGTVHFVQGNKMVSCKESKVPRDGVPRTLYYCTQEAQMVAKKKGLKFEG
ncbi:MAG TPA: hypothetical protein VMW36_09795 [Patescibacteria group bacterium]|nr:hypothetical protein [Patescibacteria group bacterium]